MTNLHKILQTQISLPSAHTTQSIFKMVRERREEEEEDVVVVVEEEDQEAPIHGDILETILSHLPLIDIVPASQVSKAWKHAVFSSLHLISLKPWLILHAQRTRPPYAVATRAYDPRSHVWIEINQPPTTTGSFSAFAALRSSHSNLLYALSSWKLSFSLDPLHLTWHHAAPPLVWRSDPIVAAVGRRLVIAGGGCDFEDDPLAVEIYDLESRTWSTCNSMPGNLRDCSASTWLSIASNDIKLFVTEKNSGSTHTFHPETNTWSGPFDLRPDPSVFYSEIAFSDGRMILVGLIGDDENVEGVKLWGVNCDTFECEEIGEMPVKLIEKLKGEKFRISSIGVCSAGNIVYMYSPELAEEVFVCEFVDGGCRWGSVRNAAAVDRNRVERLVFTCSAVGIDEVEKALKLGDRRFMAVRS